jgi:hypothetical protein
LRIKTHFINPITHGEARFLGWDRSGSVPSSGTGIHHPNGDEMKISFDYNNLTSNSYLTWNDETDSPANSHWKLEYDNGGLESGSSGSPLFDTNHRVIGQYHGGIGNCPPGLIDYYGKFNLSWSGGGSNDTRLSNWLNPTGSNYQTLDGKYAASISGSIYHCPRVRKTYTVTNLPLLATWTCSPNTILESVSGNSATFYFIGYETSAWVAINSNNTELARMNIMLQYSLTGISGPSSIPNSGAWSNYYAELECPDTNTATAWELINDSGDDFSLGSTRFPTEPLKIKPRPSCTGCTTYGSPYYTLQLTMGNVTVTKRISAPNNYGLMIQSLSEELNVLTYPNPVSDVLNIEIKSSVDENSASTTKKASLSYNISVYGMYGGLLKEVTAKEGIIQLNTSNLPNGIYYIRINRDGDEKSATKKIIVKH